MRKVIHRDRLEGEKLPDSLNKLYPNVLEKVSEGGTSTVYKTRDANGKVVAVKVMDVDQCDILECNRELRITKKMNRLIHSATLKIDNCGTMRYFLVLPFEDETLEDAIKNTEKIDYPTRLEMCLMSAKDLREIHGKGIVHKDISPDNVFVRLNGNVLIGLHFGDFGYSIDEYENASEKEKLVHTEIFNLVRNILYFILTGNSGEDRDLDKGLPEGLLLENIFKPFQKAHEKCFDPSFDMPLTTIISVLQKELEKQNEHKNISGDPGFFAKKSERERKRKRDESGELNESEPVLKKRKLNEPQCSLN